MFELYITIEEDNVKPKTIFVDSHLKGAELTLDHHQSGEKTNLDLVMKQKSIVLEKYKYIASTHIDTDTILSAVAIIFGIEKLNKKQTKIMQAACLWCDYLICELPEPYSTDGLSLHFYLKQKGFTVKKEIIKEKYLNEEEKNFLFKYMVYEVLDMLKSGVFKKDENYLQSIQDSKQRISDSIIYSNKYLTFIKAEEYFDPLIMYSLHESLVQITYNPKINRYDIGVHPKHYNKGIDFINLIEQLNISEKQKLEQEGLVFKSKWGGRKTAFGSPRSKNGKRSSIQDYNDIIKQVEEFVVIKLKEGFLNE